MTEEVEFAPRFRKFQDRIWLHILLFVLTILTTTLAGAGWYQSFNLEYLPGHPQSSFLTLTLQGLLYSATILTFLGCHELGHYFACRYYDVDASLPFFIPLPAVFTGTLGAVIRIREPIPTKRMLFDIGIAGPLAGFVVGLPALFIGLAMSRLDPVVAPTDLPPDIVTYSMGEPLLFRAMAWLTQGSVPDGFTLTLHPVAFAGWFGLLATALNLFPVGQLDGGHISYAVLGRRRSSLVTMAAIAGAIVLAFFSTSLIVWTAVMLLMLWRFGRHHPPVFDEDAPIDRTRVILAVVALVIFVLCFTPAPLDLIER